MENVLVRVRSDRVRVRRAPVGLSTALDVTSDGAGTIHAGGREKRDSRDA